MSLFLLFLTKYFSKWPSSKNLFSTLKDFWLRTCTQALFSQFRLRWPGIFRTLPWGIIQPYLEPCETLVYTETWDTRNPGIFRTLSWLHPYAYSEHCHICENLRILRTLTYLKPVKYSESSQRFKIDFFAKIVKSIIFSKALHLRSFTWFWICLSLNKYSSTCRVTSHEWLCTVWYIFRTLSIIVNLDIFRHIHVISRHIQPYCGMVRTPRNSCIFRTLPYSEFWHI